MVKVQVTESDLKATISLKCFILDWTFVYSIQILYIDANLKLIFQNILYIHFHSCSKYCNYSAHLTMECKFLVLKNYY